VARRMSCGPESRVLLSQIGPLSSPAAPPLITGGAQDFSRQAVGRWSHPSPDPEPTFRSLLPSRGSVDKETHPYTTPTSAPTSPAIAHHVHICLFFFPPRLVSDRKSTTLLPVITCHNKSTRQRQNQNHLGPVLPITTRQAHLKKRLIN